MENEGFTSPGKLKNAAEINFKLKILLCNKNPSKFKKFQLWGQLSLNSMIFELLLSRSSETLNTKTTER